MFDQLLRPVVEPIDPGIAPDCLLKARLKGVYGAEIHASLKRLQHFALRELKALSALGFITLAKRLFGNDDRVIPVATSPFR